MIQIVQSYKNGEVNIFDVPVPKCRKGGILVKNAASLISIGTEKLMIETGRLNLLGKAKARPDLVRRFIDKAKREGFISVFQEAMNRLDEPVALGYSCAGMVVEINSVSNNIKINDRVACLGAGFAGHAEFVWIPENLYVPIPDNVDFEEASFVTLGAIALHGIRSCNVTPGEKVAVVGLGLIGLLSIQILAAHGCSVVGIDIDPRKIELAKKFGADLALLSDENLLIAVENFTKGAGIDGVVITAASSDSKPIEVAASIARKNASIVLVGTADLSLTRSVFWEKELLFTVVKGPGPGCLESMYELDSYDYPMNYVRWTEKRNMEHFIELLSKKKIDVKPLISHRFKIQNALEAYDMIVNNKEFYIGVLLEYENNGLTIKDKIGKSKVTLNPAAPNDKGSVRGIGFIGGGLFTKNILLPALKKVNNVIFKGIATTTGMTSHHLAKKYGFEYCTSNYRDILEDSSIDSIVITTRHNQHCKMVIEALEAGKNVFVEKPLCITEEELRKIFDVYTNISNQKNVRFMAGFNRRYSPLAVEAKSIFEHRTTSLIMTYRVNAGYLQADHWAQNPDVGGGRIIGEVCHYIDIFQLFTNAYPVSVFTDSISGDTGKYLKGDNVCITVKFSDGSVGTIVYVATGTKAFSRERIEIFGEESAVMIDDFRELIMFKGSKKRRTKKFVQDVGYVNELDYFINSNFTDGELLFKHSIYTTLATFKAKESLEKGIPIKIQFE